MSKRPVQKKSAARATDLSGARIAVFAQPDPALEAGMRELRRRRAEITHAWPLSKGVATGMDMLVCDYFPGIAEVIPWEPGEADAALVILLPQSGGYDDADIAGSAPQGVLQRPFAGHALVTAAQVALSQFRYERRLRDRISRLDDNLRSIRYIERAKLVLMTRKGIEEAAAYRELREAAMKKRVSIVDVADAVLRQEEFGI